MASPVSPRMLPSPSLAGGMTMPPERDVLVVEDVSGSASGASSRRAGVRRASLRVGRGELVAVLGRSGSGKSALLAVCGGLPPAGRVLVAGLELGELDAAGRESLLRRTVGWVFQSPRLVPLLTAEENVALAMRLAEEPESQVHPLSLAALE